MYPVTGVHGPIILAHRGGGGEAPENSAEAFGALRALGVRHIETDAHISADGVVVVNHDETVDRTFDASGRISDFTWEELRLLRGREGQRMMSLSEVLTAHPDMYFNIDAKCDAVAVPLIQVLESHQAFGRVLVASFSERRLARMRAMASPHLSTSVGTGAVIRLIAAAQTATTAAVWRVPSPRRGVRAIQVPERQGPVRIVDKRFVATAHRAGLAVHVWTVNEADRMHALIDIGVDGIITDHPSLAKEVLSSRGLWH